MEKENNFEAGIMNTIPRPESNLCTATKEDGSRCKALRVKGDTRCWFHLRQAGENFESSFSGTIVDQIEKGMFRELFEDSNGSQESWEGWKSILGAVFGLKLSPERLNLFKDLTGREKSPEKQVQECHIIAGRRSGKSWISAVIAVFLSLFREYKNLRKGEEAHFVVISPTRLHSRVVMSYIKSILQSHPKLREQVKKELREEVQLKNGLSISVRTSSIVGSRGLTLAGAILDEASWFPKENSANPDKEVLASILPAMATVENSILISISSPYAKMGMQYEKWEKYFGVDSDRVLVIQAPSKKLNPLLSETWIQEQLDEDFEVNRAEYLAEWRQNVSAFFSENVIEQAVDLDRPEIIPPQPNTKYFGFTDGASGSAGKFADSFCLAIAHKENENVVIDGVWEVRPPFSPKSVIEEFSKILKSYGVHMVTGDRWSLGVLSDIFRMENIIYKTSTLSASELYQESAVFFHHSMVSIPNHKRLKNQMRGLERHTRKSGKDVVTHSPGSRDDIINCVSGVVCEILAGVSLDLDSPELLSRMAQTTKTVLSPNSIDRMAPWKREELIEKGEVHVLEVGGVKHFMKSSIHSKSGKKEKENVGNI